MQYVNTSHLNVTSPAVPPASTDPVPKNNLDTVISVANEPMHPETTRAISKSAGDFILLAETTLALIGSDQICQPEIDEKEASDLARLKNLKADTEQTLKGSAVHLDFSEGAMELRLITLSLELSALIDKLLKGRMESQKGRNGQIEELNNVLSELRKKEKSTDAFDAASLDKPDYVVPPGSPMQQRSIERMREEIQKEKDIASSREQSDLDYALSYSRTYGYFEKDYQGIISAGYDGEVEISPDGKFMFWNKEHSEFVWKDGGRDIFRPTWTHDYLQNAFDTKKSAFDKCDRKFNEYLNSVNSGKVSLKDLLYYYGVYKAGEKSPATKEDLEAATEKISSMVNSINSTQSMKMLDIHKFTNGRNEAYDLAVKVNNTKFDSLNALIKMIGER